MTNSTELLEGVQLTKLDKGSVLDIETQSRHYSAEYLGGDEVRISGHPDWCPTPVVVHLRGSLRNSGDFEPGFVGAGMHMVFERFDDRPPVTTTEVKELHVAGRRASRQ
jgi:hypothetical protein